VPLANWKRPRGGPNLALLQVEGLCLRFGGLDALADVSLQVDEGSCFAVIGPNGAGKTSLFNCITGYYRATSGRVGFAGRDLTNAPAWKVAAAGIRRTFQNVRVFPRLTAHENVLAGAHLRAHANLMAALFRSASFRREEARLAAEADFWLSFVGLEEHRNERAQDLPYGMRKRLEIARALMGQPRLLLLDEPAAGVSSMERAQLAEVIRRAWASGVTVVLIEHDVELVMSLANSVAVLDHGRLISKGTPGEVRRDPKVLEAYLGRRR